MTYGDGTKDNAGYCEIGEMWAYYLESKLYKERYGGNFPSFGTSYWFHPEIFRRLDERGMKTSEIYSALKENVISLQALKIALSLASPDDIPVIDQIFSRY